MKSAVFCYKDLSYLNVTSSYREAEYKLDPSKKD